MKKYSTWSGVFFLLLLFFSCKKKSSYSDLPPSSYGMYATICKLGDTTLFSSIGTSWIAAIDSGNICRIYAMDTATNAIISDFQFVIHNYVGNGSYLMGSFDNYYVWPSYGVYEALNSGYSQTVISNGSISILSTTDGNISGTFYGTLADGSVVLNGKFTARGK